MRLWQLKVFATLAKELHFGKTAEVLGVPQQSVSASIRRLEDELGVQLFVRSTRSVTMTPSAKALFANINAGVDLIEAGIKSARDVLSKVRKEIRIGYAYGTLFSSTIDIIRKFHADNPGVHISLIERSNASLPKLLMAGEVDAIFSFPVDQGYDDLDAIALRSDPLMVVMPRGHPLEACDTVTRQQISEFRLIDFDPEPSGIETETIDQALGFLGVDFRSTYSANSGIAAVSMVAMGLGITLSIERIGRHWEDYVSMRPFENANVEHVLATRPGNASVEVRQLRDCAFAFQ